MKKMTLEQKARLTTGKSVIEMESLNGSPALVIIDGPHGMHGIDPQMPSLCFPPACCVGASFDRKVAYQMGQAIARQCQAWGIAAVLGPGLNIKRSPLCGRNFEYYSEDPVLAGELATGYVNGVQSEGVSACPKHFLANNQEFRRRTSSSNVDERALNKIYMEGFRRVVTQAKPRMIMTSYNLVNGEQVAHSRYWLTDVLRTRWGFDGMVVSDWGAVKNRVAAVNAGCDLTMPEEHITDSKIVQAVQNGELPESRLDESVQRITKFIEDSVANRKQVEYDFDAAHDIARQIAENSIVLLKNDDNVLPLSGKQKILFVGDFAENPRFQGGGSSRVVNSKLSTALNAVKDMSNVTYCKGFDSSSKKIDEALLSEAIGQAKRADVVVVFAGLPENVESEGFDRSDMTIPANQNHVIEQIAKVNKNIAVVLNNGAPVEMPWVKDVKAIVELYLAGQAVGEAAVNVLFGKVNPSGRLPETFPLRLQDTPSYLTFPGDGNTSFYGESIYVGYRYYETKQIPVLFPFGHGLSYTKFGYTNLTVTPNGENYNVSVDVTNLGDRDGKEVVLLFVGGRKTGVHRPIRELKAFDKVFVQVGQTVTVNFTLTRRDFAFYNQDVHKFTVAEGVYSVEVCRNAQDVILSSELNLEGEYVKPAEPYTMYTPIAEVIKHPTGKKFVEKALPIFMSMVAKMGYLKGDAKKMMDEASPEERKQMQQKGLYAQPLNTLRLALRDMTETDWVDLLDELNA